MGDQTAMRARSSLANDAIADTRASHITRNFFTHSGHIPITLLILEFLLSPSNYLLKPDGYVLIAAGIVQACVMGTLAYRKSRVTFMCNLVGPLLYSLAEGALEGTEFFQQWHHQAYWGFGLLFTLLHGVQRLSMHPLAPLIIIENVARAAVPLVMYALFEARTSPSGASVMHFFADQAHVFLTVVLLLIGVLLGFADLNLRRSLATIRALALRLHEYSSWSMGRTVLDRAIENESTLALQRIERSILFMDIRGFTAWSEGQTPEEIVRMLNDYYHVAETALASASPIKIKYTADEVMAVFALPNEAVHAGRALLRAICPHLAAHGLGAGIGIHCGTVVEGVLGGDQNRAYDFIGDPVNTAQRICDAAAAGEILASEAVFAPPAPAAWQEIMVKGKQRALRVCRVELESDAAMPV